MNETTITLNIPRNDISKIQNDFFPQNKIITLKNKSIIFQRGFVRTRWNRSFPINGSRFLKILTPCKASSVGLYKIKPQRLIRIRTLSIHKYTTNNTQTDVKQTEQNAHS